MHAREADHPIDPLFLDRWSPRAFDASNMPEADLLTIFEAGRWAPSAFNVQPWRFLYATRGDANWARFLDLLIPFNQGWAHSASVLVYVLSDSMSQSKTGELSPSHSHSFDAGAAWACLALQATRMGYHTHGMTGVDFDRARTELAVPDRFRIEAAIAIGRKGDPENLPEHLRPREFPSDRKKISDLITAGPFAG